MSFFKQKHDEQTNQDWAGDFAGFFGPFIRGIRWFKLFAHIGSALTQMAAIYLITYSHLDFQLKYALILTSVVIAVAMSTAIEYGVAQIGPIWVRQFVRWKFHNRWFRIMFLALTILLGPLLYLSISLSGMGGGEVMDGTAPQIEAATTDSLEQAWQLRRDSATNQYAERIAEQEKIYEGMASAARRKYRSSIKEQEDSYKHHKKRKAQGAKWAQSWMDKALIAKRRLKVKRDSTLSRIQELKQQAIQPITDEKNGVIAHLHSLEAALVDTFTVRQARIVAHKENRHSKRRNFAIYIALFFASCTFGCCFVIEIYRRGAGQNYKAYVDIEKPLIGNPFNFLKGPFKSPFKKEQRRRSIQFQIPDRDSHSDESPEIQDLKKVKEIQFIDSTIIISNLRNSRRRRITSSRPEKRQEHQLKHDLYWEELERRNFKLSPSGDTTFNIDERPE